MFKFNFAYLLFIALMTVVVESVDETSLSEKNKNSIQENFLKLTTCNDAAVMADEKFPSKCQQDDDCKRTGQGETCCLFKSHSYCVKKKKANHDQVAGCWLYEANYTGKYIQLDSGEARKNINYADDDHHHHNLGFRSVRLVGQCKLRLCYERSKDCYNFVVSDYFQDKKPLPNYISCQCSSHHRDGIDLQGKNLILKNNSTLIRLEKGHEAVTVTFGFFYAKNSKFQIRLGKIKIEIGLRSIEILNNSVHQFRASFRSSKKAILPIQIGWLSFRRGTIKLGHDYVLEANHLVTFETNSSDT
jgi:hypothetical protein